MTLPKRNNPQQSETKRNISFNEGGRDESLFHLANHLVKGGMDASNIEEYMKFIGSNCIPPFPENELQQKIRSAIERAERRKIKLTQAVRDFVGVTFRNFSVTNVLQTVTTRNTPEERAKIRVILGRLVDSGVIERVGNQDGWYRRVENECEDIDFLNADDKALDLWLPLGINNMAETMPGNIIVIAGVPNAGKTAFLLNIARFNWDKFKIFYFSSEMGESELKKRLRNFNETTLQQWHERVRFKERSDEFADVIKSGNGHINIVDFLELHDNFYEIGGRLADIHKKLKGAVAVVAIQKNPGADTGLGGWRGVEKPRLYLNIGTDNICRIVKAKNWATTENPNGKQIKYIIRGGCNLSQSGVWHEPLKI